MANMQHHDPNASGPYSVPQYPPQQSAMLHGGEQEHLMQNQHMEQPHQQHQEPYKEAADIPPRKNYLMLAGKINQILCFVAACSTLAGAFLGFWLDLFAQSSEGWAIDNIVSTAFLVACGLLMAIADSPISPAWLLVAQQWVDEYFRFMCRKVGRGIFYIFLGGLLSCQLYEAGTMEIYGVIFGLYVGVIGIVELVMGLMATSEIERLRKNVGHPPHSQWVTDVDPCFQNWKRAQVYLLFNALDHEKTGRILPDVFLGWMQQKHRLVV